MNFENDADWDMLALESAGDRIAELKKMGICLHGWTQEIDGQIKCLDCVKIVTREEIDDLRYQYL